MSDLTIQQFRSYHFSVWVISTFLYLHHSHFIHKVKACGLKLSLLVRPGWEKALLWFPALRSPRGLKVKHLWRLLDSRVESLVWWWENPLLPGLCGVSHQTAQALFTWNSWWQSWASRDPWWGHSQGLGFAGQAQWAVSLQMCTSEGRHFQRRIWGGVGKDSNNKPIL
jgi:hypothetical protein